MSPAPFSTSHIALLGGSFNPPHAGHFRIAIEVHETLAPWKTLFIPCATPPHKPTGNLLPFELRASMLQCCLDEFAQAGPVPAACNAAPGSPAAHGGGFALPGRMEVCTVENERSGPSYTVDTLALLAEQYPGKRLAFVMGAEDYHMLPTWRNWQRIAELADLVVLPRGMGESSTFHKTTRDLWPDAQAVEPPFPAVQAAFTLEHGGRLLYLPQPRLEISSSLVRERWAADRSLAFLVPQCVQDCLRKEHALVSRLWGGKQAAGAVEPRAAE